MRTFANISIRCRQRPATNNIYTTGGHYLSECYTIILTNNN